MIPSPEHQRVRSLFGSPRGAPPTALCRSGAFAAMSPVAIDRSGQVVLAEALGVVTIHLDPVGPVVCRQPGLVFQLGQELDRVRQALPYGRQKGPPVRTILQDQPVLARPDLCDQVRFVVETPEPLAPTPATPPPAIAADPASTRASIF